MSDLVERLRDYSRLYAAHDAAAAADRIEALERENAELRKRLGENDDDRRS